MQEKYQSLRYEYGGIVSAIKYLLIAILCGLLVLVVIPGRYLEKLIARPGGPVAAPGAIHYLLSAMAVGVVLADWLICFRWPCGPLWKRQPGRGCDWRIAGTGAVDSEQRTTPSCLKLWCCCRWEFT